MLRVKRKYRCKVMSNGILGVFNSSDITETNQKKYINGGFAHIFEEVCDDCSKKKCTCTK